MHPIVWTLSTFPSSLPFMYSLIENYFYGSFKLKLLPLLESLYWTYLYCVVTCFFLIFLIWKGFFLTTKSRINPTSSNDAVTQPSVHFRCATNCSSYFFLSFLAVLKALHKGTQPCLCCLLFQSKFLYCVRHKICT